MAKRQKKRRQKQQKFWLDTNKSDERDLADWCDSLREKRRFTTVVRGGLVLMEALERGDASVLFQMFPNLRETLSAQMEAEILARRENESIRRFDLLESLIKNIQASPAPPLGGIKSLSVPTLTAPVYEDDEGSVLTVVAATVDSAAIFKNFIGALGKI